jgi:hypothetical protein
MQHRAAAGYWCRASHITNILRRFWLEKFGGWRSRAKIGDSVLYRSLRRKGATGVLNDLSEKPAGGDLQDSGLQGITPRTCAQVRGRQAIQTVAQVKTFELSIFAGHTRKYLNSSG